MDLGIRKILVVEDEAIIAMALAADLEDMGYEAALAGSGEEALEMFRQELFDLVLMDIQLSGNWDGIETIQRIQELANPKVVFITGNSEKGTVNKLQSLKTHGFLVKPINTNDLRLLLDAIQHQVPKG
ncbi:response regulator [Flammeovirgaceae bacterium 311]|nr:response regulator [Flammeovirgaceae bacterium 311]